MLDWRGFSVSVFIRDGEKSVTDSEQAGIPSRFKSKNPNRLNKSLRDLGFEIFHYQIHRQLVRTNPFLPQLYDDAVEQAIMYALLLHFRLLIDFFYLPQAKQDDIVAQNFIALPGFDKSVLRKLRKPTWLEGMRAELSKRLAHLSEARLDDHAPGFDYYAVRFAELDTAIGDFARALPVDSVAILRDRLAEFNSQSADLYIRHPALIAPSIN
jgi:hypothetical protein